MKRSLAVLLLVWLGAARLAHAELYSYVDAEGVVHFTNVPRRAVQPQGDNSFLWEDEEGRLQRVHRVDVTVFDPLIEAAASYYSLPSALVKAVVSVESNFDPHAVSVAGAQGLMQMLPETGRQMFVGDLFEPNDNVYGGCRYLRILANRFAGDLRLTLAAYNAGPEVVERSGGVPNIPETRAYVRRVLALYRHYLTAGKTP